MKKEGFARNLKLSLPPREELEKTLFGPGTFSGGDPLFNREDEVESALIRPPESQLSLADFEVVRVIGRGSGGFVRRKTTGQFFALKVIQRSVEVSARKHIEQELKINMSSQCPYIVVCHQSFYDNGTIFILLEYMDGGSLAELLKGVCLIPEPYLAKICKQVLKGLWYLHHDRHILHRDLKPSNLLINHKGEVKISDFGVSTILASMSDLAKTCVGTYSYMSPERITGGNHGYQSDIWSLGLVLLECATGEFPYSSPHSGGWVNVYELTETIVDQPAPCASSNMFSPEFCSFITACLQKDPQERLPANELMMHPFITKYDGAEVDLAMYFRSTSYNNLPLNQVDGTVISDYNSLPWFSTLRLGKCFRRCSKLKIAVTVFFILVSVLFFLLVSDYLGRY